MKGVKFHIITLFSIITFSSAYSQNLNTASGKRIEIGAYYPFILGNDAENNFNALYDGIVGIDAKFIIKKLPFINIKLGSTFDYFKLSNKNVVKGSSLRLHPNMIVGIDLSKFVRLEPYLGIGYSFIFDNGEIKSSNPDLINQDSGNTLFMTEGDSYSESDNNLFYKIGVNYKLSKLVYIDTHLYMANLFATSDLEDISEDNFKQIVLNIGLGAQF